VRANEYKRGQWVYYFNPRKFVGRQDKWERKYTGPFLIIGTPSPVTVQLQRSKGAETMTVHIDKVKPFLGEVPKSWLADEPSSDIAKLPERPDGKSTEATSVKEPNKESSSEKVYAKSAEDELANEESATGTNIDYEVDNTQPLDRPRREVRAPKYLGEYVR